MSLQLSESFQAEFGGLVPFTLEHFRAWAFEVVLDNDERWVLEPFQERFVEDLFSDRTVCWLCIPEGNGKTTLIAGIGLYWCEYRDRSRVLACAAALDQAQVMYDQAEGMVLRTPRLHRMAVSSVLQAKGKRSTDRPFFECLEGWKRINHVNGSRFQVKPADDRTGDGVIPTLCLIDELHRHRNLALYRTWAGKLRKRGGKLIVISTAGEPGGEFEATREAMRQGGEVTHGECFTRSVTDKWVLHDWAVPEGTDVMDFETVAKANPLSYVTAETLRETWDLPGQTIQHFSRLNANLPMRSGSAAIPERVWHDAASGERIPADADVWVGMDFGWQWDTTALVPFWWRDSEYRLLGPATIIEPPRDGSHTDPKVVKRAIKEICSQYRVSTVVMDPDRAQDIAGWMSDELNLVVVERAQTSKPQGEDFERFMEALRSGWLRHSGDPGMRQHALNAVTKLLPDGGAKFDRSTQSRDHSRQPFVVIDALVAAAMVHSYAVEAQEDNGSLLAVAFA